MHHQKLYYANDHEKSLELLYDFNQTRPSQQGKREILLKKMFVKIGSVFYIKLPFQANRGGEHVHFGRGGSFKRFIKLI